jgi:hypothetical protein
MVVARKIGIGGNKGKPQHEASLLARAGSIIITKPTITKSYSSTIQLEAVASNP